jgi:uncharacterized protein (DUF433 family)
MKISLEPKDRERLPVAIDPEVMGGTPVFKGTRVPIDALWENLADGVSLEEFLENFPTVGREQAHRLIEWAMETSHAVLEAA